MNPTALAQEYNYLFFKKKEEKERPECKGNKAINIMMT